MKYLDYFCKMGIKLFLIILAVLIFFSVMNNKELNHSNVFFTIHSNDKCNSVSSNQFIAKLKNNQLTDSLHLLVNEKNRIILSKKEKLNCRN